MAQESLSGRVDLHEITDRAGARFASEQNRATQQPPHENGQSAPTHRAKSYLYPVAVVTGILLLLLLAVV